MERCARAHTHAPAAVGLGVMRAEDAGAERVFDVSPEERRVTNAEAKLHRYTVPL